MATISFQRKWVLANSLAFAFGYLLYTPIAHGFTGGHSRQLTPAQLIAHSLALAVAGLIVATTQVRVLNSRIKIARWRVPFAVVAGIAAFWFGGYLTVAEWMPDLDLIFGFTAQGCLVWLGSFPVGGNRRLWVLLAVLAFAASCLVGQVVAILIAFGLGLTPEMLQVSMFIHAFYFVTVAISTGVLGGLLSGMFFAKALPAGA